MKNQELYITFHNPNTAEDSQKLAETFISEIAQRAFDRYILEQDKISVPIKLESNLD